MNNHRRGFVSAIHTDGKQDHGVGGHGAGLVSAPGGGQLGEGGRDVHGVGVDEGEEEEFRPLYETDYILTG